MSLPVPSTPVGALPVSAPAPAPRPDGGWATQMARLVGWELFLAWRRRGMVITLGALLFVGYALVELFVWLTWVNTSQDSEVQSQVAKLLVFPGAISLSGQYFNEIGTLLLIVLAGALVGSEYSYGTHRLSLARGVGRGQLLMAQVVALAILALVTSGATLLLGAVAGGFGQMGIGGSPALSVAGFGELLGFWLAIALNTFAYALVALWMGTLGRSVAAAIAGPLVYIFVELVASNLLGVFRYALNPDAMTRFVGSIPDYLLSSNTSEVIQLSGQSPYALLEYTGHLGWAHALVMIALYSALFIVSAYLVFRGRDVRE